jgi:hypothetical protein
MGNYAKATTSDVKKISIIREKVGEKIAVSPRRLGYLNLSKYSDYSMTWMAPSGHCISHALQTRQSSMFTATDFPSFIS